jgi:hypothetical protein
LPISSPLCNQNYIAGITIAKLLSDRNKINLKERFQSFTEEEEVKITEVVLEDQEK